jgi:isopenicillin-N N-acyltransferase-like protein
MSYTPYVLPRIELRGTPFEIGKKFGELERVRIHLHLFNQKNLMTRLHPQEPDWWKREVYAYLPPYEELAPHFVEEMRGLARGTDLSFEEILLLNVRDEVINTFKPIIADTCTSFGCSGQVTLSGEPILGQTKDTGGISRDLFVVTAMYQKNRPDLLQMPYAGELGVFGLSSSGMSAFGNSIYVRGRARGKIPWSLFRRLVLEADSVAQVIDLVEEHGITAAGNLTIGDRTGRVIAIENTDHGHGIVDQTNGILVHANHINTPALQQFEDYPEPEKSGSLQRQARLRELLEVERGRLTAPLAMRCLMDHANYPRSICRHPSSPDDMSTTAALVVEPTLGLLHAIRGQACQGWAETYSL